MNQLSDVPPPPRDADLQHFNQFITKLEGGALNEELSDLVRQCVQEISDACLDRAGKHTASITLKLDFTMNHKDKLVEIGADIASKFPKAPRGRVGLFFCDAEGNLTRENPRQMTFEDELEKRRKDRLVHAEANIR